jgi:hypothetical protein
VISFTDVEMEKKDGIQKTKTAKTPMTDNCNIEYVETFLSFVVSSTGTLPSV